MLCFTSHCLSVLNPNLVFILPVFLSWNLVMTFLFWSFSRESLYFFTLPVFLFQINFFTSLFLSSLIKKSWGFTLLYWILFLALLFLSFLLNSFIGFTLSVFFIESVYWNHSPRLSLINPIIGFPLPVYFFSLPLVFLSLLFVSFPPTSSPVFKLFWNCCALYLCLKFILSFLQIFFLSSCPQLRHC